jgi:hypothetical protein
MIDPALIKEIAPISAVLAFEQYVRLKEWARKNHYKV